MQSRALLMLLVALIMGGIAVVLVQSLLKQQKGGEVAVQTVKTRSVLVAANDLQVGSRLDAMSLSVVDWPEGSVPDKAYSTRELALGADPAKAPVVLKEIRKGEVVLPYKLSSEGARPLLTPKIPTEMRAMTIAVNEIKGVAGFILPGDKVDVVLTSNLLTPNKDEPVTLLLEQSLMVLGVDQQSSEGEDKPVVVNAVTLLVTPEIGKRLTLAQTVGDLTLLLRNEADTTQADQAVVTLASLRGLEPVAEPPKPVAIKAPARRIVRRAAPATSGTVEIVRGLDIDSQTVRSVGQ
ncbi:MAG: Flp pilus assembly protein CpaB [Halothiobacillaceae bacterium]|nr:MAG: Flp pilus assembly protein CpaB [Halothiobacillaceae bacterium]